MKTVSGATTAAWQASTKVGANRPMMRATLANLDVKFTQYHLKDAPGHQAYGFGSMTSAIFGQDHIPVEIPNIKSINWNRNIEQDVATMKMQLWNTEILPLGTVPEDDYEFELPGYFTNRRGSGATMNPWGYEKNEWHNRLTPDRVIRTFEGYGFDPDVIPEEDPNLYPSGVWLIDVVEYGADGLITVEARDMGRILIDQICFPNVIPPHEYPLVWEPHRQVENRDTVKELTDWSRPNYDTDSNIPWVGLGYMDGEKPYVNANGGVAGHYGRHAFDGTYSTYWLSVGNQPEWDSAYEYVQGKFGSRDVAGIQLRTWGGPYRVYVSVFADGEWKGRRKIPYRPRDDVNTGAKIHFVSSFTVSRNGDINYKLPRTISQATKIRLTFNNLSPTGVGELSYRAGVREIRVASDVEKVPNPGTHPEGNHNDYTDIVKWFCAWGGFYWPTDESGNNYWTKSDGTQHVEVGVDDPDLSAPDTTPYPGGSIWGDLQPAGTAAITDLGMEIWDKKPLLDGIKYVKDVLGYIFWVDEQGGICFRQPNVWKMGNFEWPESRWPTPVYNTDDFVTITENETLIQMSARSDSANIRERVFVGNTNGRVGAVVKGWNPRPSRLRRVSGWTDENFETNQECRVMAKLIAARQRFTFRRNTLTIPGYPAIQIDDQVWIEERHGYEWDNLHYITGITSDWDITQGKWTYQLTTHWLGRDPGDDTLAPWWWHNEHAGDLLDDATRNYLREQGSL